MTFQCWIIKKNLTGNKAGTGVGTGAKTEPEPTEMERPGADKAKTVPQHSNFIRTNNLFGAGKKVGVAVASELIIPN